VLDPDADPPVDSLFHFSTYTGTVSLYTDYAKPLTLSAYGSIVGRSYNYRRHYFAPYFELYVAPGWQITPSLCLGLSADNTVELDTLNRVEQQNWIITPTFSYALTRDLQFSLNGEFVPADTTGRLTLLISWNLKPKSWLYLVWNEQRTLASGIPLLHRDGALKLRYLFYF
jgi:hypothetical protein